MWKHGRSIPTAFVIALAWVSSLSAVEPAATVITVPDLHCPACVRKVTTKLTQVAGVGNVRSNLDDKTVTAMPRGEAVLSPRALWEAVERAGKHPTRLDGPSGTFTAKPQS